MINRELIANLKKLGKNMPVITVTGPRQSGKTTLCKLAYPKHAYVTLENIDDRQFAENDPRGFLAQFTKPVIIDEAQYVPQLFSYIQGIVDETNISAQFVLSGSQNFLLLEKISQTLAGRAAIFYLLPLSIAELKHDKKLKSDYKLHLFNGFYPRLYDKKIDVNLFYESYIATYTERDVRQIINVQNLSKFQIFLKCIAGRVGQLINFAEIANIVSVDAKTVQKWFSLLESSFICFLLPPYYKNYNKRLVKTSKLYFYDTGLVCALLGIRDAEELTAHWVRGALFENLIIADTLKSYYNKGRKPQLYFWRDNTGNEVDLIIDEHSKHRAVEIKSGTTVHTSFFEGLTKYQKFSNINNKDKVLVYGGSKNQEREFIAIKSWKEMDF